MDHQKDEFVPADILGNKKEEPSKLSQEDTNCLECNFSCIQGCV